MERNPCKEEKLRIPKKKEYKEIYQLISKGINHLDEIYKNTNNNIGEVNHILLKMELEGYIKKVTGGYQCI